MRITCLMLVTLLGLLFPMAMSSAAEKGDRPNILFIFTDDQTHRSVSAYPEAADWVSTPNIDRLGREGVRFSSFYASSWCLPSRAIFLTGLQPHGIQGMKVERNPVSTYDPERCKFWPAELRKAGYTTAQIGKWHLSPDAGFGRDWDHQVVWNHAEPAKAGGYYDDQKLRIDGGDYQLVPGYPTDVYTDYATKFIERKHDQPWFLWLCYGAAHGPYTPAERHQGAYRNNEPVEVPADIYPPRENKPAYMREYGLWKKGPNGEPVSGKNDKTLANSVRQYQRVVLGIDEGVGRLLETLERTGQLDNTLIVYTSDQGFAWGHHGFAWKVAPYDDNLLCPTFVRLPGRVAQGKVIHTSACTLDLVPTFFAMAKAPLPWAMHGHDLSPLLADPEAEWRHPVMLEHFHFKFGAETDGGNTGQDYHGKVPWYIFLRQGRYKYIRTLVDDEIEELYDVEADPHELHNLAVEPQHREKLADYRQRLVAELRRTKAPLVDTMPEPKKSSQ